MGEFRHGYGSFTTMKLEVINIEVIIMIGNLDDYFVDLILLNN